MIDPDRLQHIPRERHAQHTFCFWLHDRILDVMRQAAAARVADVFFHFGSEEEKQSLTTADDAITYFLKSGHRDIAKRIVVNQTVIPLYADALHFIFEGLEALEKHKFTVAFSLFRKPLRQNLLFLTWLFADEEDFFARMHTDPASLDRNVPPETKRLLLAKAISRFSFETFFGADVIYGMAFDKRNPRSLAHYFDKAAHLVTYEASIRTEDLNLNFIFKNPSDTDVYDDVYYLLAYLLMYLLFLEIEIIGKMAAVPEFYMLWLTTATVGSFESLFSERTDVVDRLNKVWAEILECTLCGASLRVTREGALLFFSTDQIQCQSCQTVQQFPLFWLMSKFRGGDPGTIQEPGSA